MIAGFTWLNEAVCGKKDAVLRFGPGESDQLAARFDGEVAEPGDAFRLVFTGGDAPALDPLIESGQAVEVAFNTPAARVFFDALPVRRGRRWFTHWAALRWPERLTIVERRTGSREQVPDDMEVVAALTPADTSTVLRSRVWDIDLHGVSCICRLHPDLPVPEIGEPCGIMLSSNGVDHHLSGFCRNVQRLSSNSVRVGFSLRSEAEFEPATLVRFKHFLEELHTLRIRRSFRQDLRTTVMYTED
jgi:hypothetical protein